tara:strand:+ start:77 stop:406 length:330 start_codon:yes stop_codon:yes gene_type:complete
MSDFFDNFNKILKKDLVPIFTKYFKDPNNKINDNFNDFLNDPREILTDILEKFSRIKDIDDNQTNYNDIQNVNDIDPTYDDEYAELLERLTSIEETLIQVKKIFKQKNN